MDEYVGTATELRGRFNIHSSNIVDDNLKQIVCSTAKETFKKQKRRLKGHMQFNDKKQQFNFLKSLDIININAEVENFHPSTHEFWETNSS